ncbi:hypothetical protein D3C73_1111620 [compost metagenome]
MSWAFSSCSAAFSRSSFWALAWPLILSIRVGAGAVPARRSGRCGFPPRPLGVYTQGIFSLIVAWHRRRIPASLRPPSNHAFACSLPSLIGVAITWKCGVLSSICSWIDTTLSGPNSLSAHALTCSPNGVKNCPISRSMGGPSGHSGVGSSRQSVWLPTWMMNSIATTASLRLASAEAVSSLP